MTPAQVQFVLGPAMVKDPQPEPLDYVRYVTTMAPVDAVISLAAAEV